MQHSTCPYVRLNGTTADAPRSLEELMKRCTLLKPKLDPLYFRELGENPFHKLFRDTSQDIILTEYAHQSDSPASLYRPPPSAETGFSQMFLQDDTQDTGELDGAVPGTQNGNPIIAMVPPLQDTTGVEDSPIASATETESQTIDTTGISPQYSTHSNLITGESATFQEKGTQTPEQQQLQQHASKLKSKVLKSPNNYKPWTTQEDKLLVIGVKKFGKSWEKIHSTLNFSPSRSVSALAQRYYFLRRNGKQSIYLREFLRNTGRKEITRETAQTREYGTALQCEESTMDICLLQLKSATRERGKRGRKLLIDSCKVLSSQMIRSQISDYTDITHRARSLPPVSSRAIQCRGSADESLLAMPAIAFNQDRFPGPILDIFKCSFRRISQPTSL